MVRRPDTSVKECFTLVAITVWTSMLQKNKYMVIVKITFQPTTLLVDNIPVERGSRFWDHSQEIKSRIEKARKGTDLYIYEVIVLLL